MPSRKEILEDLRANNIQLQITVYSKVEGYPEDEASCSNSRDATDEEIENMNYWELWRNWKQAKHTRDIVAGIVRA